LSPGCHVLHFSADPYPGALAVVTRNVKKWLLQA
jgi:hypothetical protein